MVIKVIINFALIILGAYLWYQGGQDKKAWCRDILIPVILAIYSALLLRWWLFFVVGACACIIHLGYGAYDAFDDKLSFLAQFWAKLGIRDRQGAIIRLIWGFIVAVVIGLPFILTHHLGLWLYLLYIFINTLINFLVSKLRLPVLPTDLLVGSGVMSILLFVR